ncbi:hypothetical protein Tdes44962_MAKER02385 [Teratosphaeria destructans]|uniref:Nucleotidyltransferase n=1 Tax=Teratosphaeria destructans TaxID=418781 RepID=A0A9W7STS9_9PEZI|nr:hypothetical protein Tdes44962_MAKER02385 [Teratosphaeria destructans]
MALRKLNVQYGIFGGYAIATLGGPRESKDIDCVVGCTKEWLVSMLSQVKDFHFMGNLRPDLAQFIYGDRNILIELFPTSMTMMTTVAVLVTGEKLPMNQTNILHPVFLYKGKLQAAATRAKYSDAADLMFLENKHADALRDFKDQIKKQHVGMVVRRYPHLRHSFARIGVDLEACEALVSDFDPESTPTAPAVNSVQNALLYNVRVPEAGQALLAVASSSRQPAVTLAESALASLPLDRAVIIGGRYYMRTQRGIFVVEGSQWVAVPDQRAG